MKEKSTSTPRVSRIRQLLNDHNLGRLSNVYKIIIDRKDIDVHFRFYVNHKLAGKLVMPLLMYDEFEAIITSFDGTVTTESFVLKNTRLPCEKGRKDAVRELHQSRDNSRD